MTESESVISGAVCPGKSRSSETGARDFEISTIIITLFTFKTFLENFASTVISISVYSL